MISSLEANMVPPKLSLLHWDPSVAHSWDAALGEPVPLILLPLLYQSRSVVPTVLSGTIWMNGA